jgi:hypothetical protein
MLRKLAPIDFEDLLKLVGNNGSRFLIFLVFFFFVVIGSGEGFHELFDFLVRLAFESFRVVVFLWFRITDDDLVWDCILIAVIVLNILC